MKFYFSAIFVSVLMYLFIGILVFVGLLIGYGWHVASELYDFVTLQGDGGGVLTDTAKAVTITALLLPYLAAGYIAGRIAHGAEYFNAALAAVVIVGPFFFFYPPNSNIAWTAYAVAVTIMLLGAVMAHWTRVSDAKRLARMKDSDSNGG